MLKLSIFGCTSLFFNGENLDKQVTLFLDIYSGWVAVKIVKLPLGHIIFRNTCHSIKHKTALSDIKNI